MNLFVYGTLMADEVVLRVLGRSLKSTPAAVNGYRRVCLKHRVYPGLVKSSKSNHLSGRILHNLKSEDFQILDDYEDEYKREEEEVTLQDGTKMTVFVYVWASGMDQVIEQEWDYQKWWNATFHDRDYDLEDIM